VRALVVPARGAVPEAAEVDPPAPRPGHALLRVRAAPLNPVDRAVAAGGFYVPVPDPPYVAGAEAVGTVEASDRLPAGTRAWALTLTGAMAELVLAPEEAVAPVPDGVDDALAGALGIAGLAGWMAVHARGGLAPGETVVVLGAGGVVGQAAVQAARAGGAGRVVAVARSAEGRERASALGAETALPIDDGLPAALRDATAPGAHLVVDTLWGPAAAAALGALRRGGRLVQVGNAAAPTLELAAGPLRGGRLDVRGLSVLTEEPGEVARSYAEIAAAALAGDVRLAVETLPLAEGPAAWRRLAAGAGGAKLVLVP
jgi:NADPH:quinone reductase-like Zn-dependent oxidoreductase